MALLRLASGGPVTMPDPSLEGACQAASEPVNQFLTARLEWRSGSTQKMTGCRAQRIAVGEVTVC